MSTPRLPTLGGQGAHFNVSPREPRARRNNPSHEASPRGRRAGRSSKERTHAHFERVERESLPTSVSPVDEPTGSDPAAEEPIAPEPPFRKAKLKEIKALAKVFDARLGTRPVESRSVAMFVTWNDLYNHMDSDGSGHVDYDEFEWMVRKELGVRASSLPDPSLRGLFAALDHDGSGYISFGEFAHFMRFYSKRMRVLPPNAPSAHHDGALCRERAPVAIRGLHARPCGESMRVPCAPPQPSMSTAWTRSRRCRRR